MAEARLQLKVVLSRPTPGAPICSAGARWPRIPWRRRGGRTRYWTALNPAAAAAPPYCARADIRGGARSLAWRQMPTLPANAVR